MSHDAWLSVSEYARAYGVDRSTVYKFMDAGLLDYYRVHMPGILVVRIRNIPPNQQTTPARLIVQTCPWVDYLAVDASSKMIAAARSQPTVRSRLRFAHRDVEHLPQGHFDMVITERMLINLQGWEARKAGIDAIADRLNSGGQYVMCESSQEGLDAINGTRQTLGLPAIPVPWHNGTYLSDAELVTVTSLRLVRCEPFSATYYFVSRIINAKLAHDVGQEPAYDAPVNRLALDLPAVGPWAQGRCWIWHKP